MSENVSAEAQEHHPASVGSVMGETYTGYYVVCSCQANEYGDGPRIPAREYPAHLAAHQPARVVPSAEEVEQIKAERDAAQEHLRYHLADFRPLADGNMSGDLAVDMAAYASRLKADLEEARAALASQPTVAQVREQVAREIEAYRGPVPWELPGRVEGIRSWIDSKDATLAARIARGETKGGE